MQGTVWIEPDNMWVYAACGAGPVCVAGYCRGRSSVSWRERLQGQTGINPGCSKMKQLGQDSAREARKDGIRGRDHNERKKALQQERAPPARLVIHHGKCRGASPG